MPKTNYKKPFSEYQVLLITYNENRSEELDLCELSGIIKSEKEAQKTYDKELKRALQGYMHSATEEILEIQLREFEYTWDEDSDEYILDNETILLDNTFPSFKQHISFLSKLATDAIKKKDYRKAIELWKEILELDEMEDTIDSEKIEKKISQAEQALR